MKATVPVLIVLLLVLSACRAMGGAPPSGSPPPSEGGAGIEHPIGAQPILAVDWQGGYTTVQHVATRTPAFVLYGDGRVIMLGAQTMEYPGPALPPLMQRTLNESGIQAVLSAVTDTSLFETDLRLDGAMNVVADVNDTVFTLVAEGREVTVSIYGLGMGPMGSSSTSAMSPTSRLRTTGSHRRFAIGRRTMTPPPSAPSRPCSVTAPAAAPRAERPVQRGVRS